MKELKTQKGITLVALIITIVVLLILAAVAIGTVKDSDIIGYAKDAVDRDNQAKGNESSIISGYENILKQYATGENSGGGSASLDHSGVVQSGGEYSSGGMKYEPGDTMPTPQPGDTYMYGDYIYTYDGSYNCWNVKVRDNTQDKYGELLNKINGKEIGIMERTFENCSNLTTNVPKIPATVKYLIYTFEGCTNLEEMPKIPYGVVQMIGTFRRCTNLSKVTNIPDSVGNMIQCFSECSSIESITLPSSVTSIGQAFVGCNALISITIKKAEGSLNLDTPIPSGLTNAQKASIVWAP